MQEDVVAVLREWGADPTLQNACPHVGHICVTYGSYMCHLRIRVCVIHVYVIYVCMCHLRIRHMCVVYVYTRIPHAGGRGRSAAGVGRGPT